MSLRRRFGSFLPRHDLLTRVALVVFVLLLVVAIVGPYLPLGSPDKVGSGPPVEAPSSSFPLGTDQLGRSLLPRLVEGLQATFLVSAIAVLISTVLSVVLALVAATGPIKGATISRAADVIFSFPSVLLAMLIVAISGPGSLGVGISIVLITAPLMVLVIRAAALSVVGRDFVTAARVGGAGTTRILGTHVLPNVAGSIAVQATYAFSVGILIEGTLSFLGFGIQPPSASLGSLVHEGAPLLAVAPWFVAIPGTVLALAIISVNLLGDGIRDQVVGKR
jgi:peptide/nickel transport system permease protein